MSRIPATIATATATATTLLAAATFSSAAEPEFHKILIDSKFRSEGVNVADINKDGEMDVIVGDFWYEGPQWKVHRIRNPRMPQRGGYTEAFAIYTDDFNKDGWTDVMVIPFHDKDAKWYENPKNAGSGNWKEYTAFKRTGNETRLYVDLFKDGKKVFLMGVEDAVAYVPVPEDPTKPWPVHNISPKYPNTEIKKVNQSPAFKYAHGLGIGDVNGDGLQDVTWGGGWFQQPSGGRKDAGTWKHHFKKIVNDNTADMRVVDADGDGLNDVLCTSAHGTGLYYCKQEKDGSWKTEVSHKGLIHETHSVEWADMNDDGRLDMVTGRRFFAHGFRPEKVDEDSQLCWFDVKMTKGKPVEFIPHMIDEQSGVGAQFVTTDFNKDGKTDVVVSNRKGVFVFLQKSAKADFAKYKTVAPVWKEEAAKFKVAAAPRVKAKPTTDKGAGKPVFESKIVDTKSRSVEIKASIKGAKKLYLVVDDAGDFSHDWANWISPKLVGPKGEKKLTSLKWKSASQQWGKTRVGKNAGGGSMQVKGKKLEDGIGTHANSIIEYEIPSGDYTEFHATGVIDDGGVQGTDKSAVQFLVYTKLPAPRQKKLARAAAGKGGFDPEAYKTVDKLGLDMFNAHDDLEVSVWAESPLFYNPTNIDVDKDGRIWVAECVRYRGAQGLRPEGDRIMVLEDSNGDGKADKSHVFVQEEFLLSPLGIAVIDNKIIVSQTPTILVYTDVNRNLKFDPGVDTREELLTGFQGRNHDHSLHSITAGPDGQWYFNHGNCGSTFTDKSGKTFRIGSPYMNREVAGQKSDDGNVWLGGATIRMNPDGTNAHVIGNNYRNSYEQCVTSFGDVFQNDNDDPPASRTTFVMEYGNAGFASSDGKRSWQADRRPGQPTERAEWRQDDPGTMPAGDVYGGGSPTGIAHYENGALGKKYEGLLLSCEPARNVVFGYHPELQDAGYKLERFNFVTTNPEKDFAGADFRGGASWEKKKTLFRPSDVAVGVDGAIYVADWFDPRVGGHQMIDRTCYGTIYRIAPKGFTPKIPKFDLETTEGQVTALRSPAVNVRNLGFVRLQQAGAKAVPAVAALLEDDNRFIRGRAIWLLSQMGDSGIAKVVSLLSSNDEMTRVAAYRALRRQNHQFLPMAAKMAKDPSPAVRREVALSMRNEPFLASKDILLDIATGFDGKDRAYLEALGTGCKNKEPEMYDLLNKSLGGNALFWSDSFSWIAWRMMTPDAIPHLSERALAASLPVEARKLALDALAFIKNPKSADALIKIATSKDDPLQKDAEWWISHRHKNEWREFNHAAKLNSGGVAEVMPKGFVMPDIPESKLPPVKEILALKGDAVRGKTTAMRCIMCHRVGELGVDFGPTLDGWGKKFNNEQIVAAIVEPHKEIALGFEGTEIKTKDGNTWQGRIVQEGDPVVITIMGGKQYAIDAKNIQSRSKMKKSLMLSAGQLKLQPQDVRDLVEFLKSN